MLPSLLALSFVSPAAAERRIEVQWQELRIDDVTPAKDGVRVEGQARDACRLFIQNPYWYEGHTEEDRPCGDWRELELTEPERKLVVEPVELLLRQRGPRVSGELHKLRAEVRAPQSLQGSSIELVHQDGSFLLPAQELGMVLVLADFRGVELPHLTLALDGELLPEQGEAVELRWEAPGRDAPVDEGSLRIEGEVLDLLGEGWRCEALQKAAPADYAALGEVQALAGYAAKTCEAAALVQGPPLCTRAASELVDLESALRLQAEIEPVAGFCGKSWARPAAAWAEEQIALHLRRGDLDLALQLVEAFPDELGAERSAQLREELRKRVQAELPSRFDWALQNGAEEQARELLERYGPLLGEDWVSAARARLD